MEVHTETEWLPIFWEAVMSMNRLRGFRYFISSIVFCLIGIDIWGAIPFAPLTFAALWVPLFGKASGAKAKVNHTMTNVDNIVTYLKLFLIVISAILLAVFLLLVLQKLRKRSRRRMVRTAMTLFHRLQADLVMMYSIAKEKFIELESSKKDTINLLKEHLQKRFFRKKLDRHAYHRIHESLALFEINKIDPKNQIIMIDQWLKTLDLLYR